MHFYKSALAVRGKLITPRLAHTKPLGAKVLAAQDGQDANALVARWRLGDGQTLSIALNLSQDSVPFPQTPDGKVIFETPPRVRDRVAAKELPSFSFLAWLTGDISEYAIGHDARKVAEQEPRA
jgi:maltooligosyltrehalose trehalohydrolase